MKRRWKGGQVARGWGKESSGDRRLGTPVINLQGRMGCDCGGCWPGGWSRGQGGGHLARKILKGEEPRQRSHEVTPFPGATATVSRARILSRAGDTLRGGPCS